MNTFYNKLNLKPQLPFEFLNASRSSYLLTKFMWQHCNSLQILNLNLDNVHFNLCVICEKVSTKISFLLIFLVIYFFHFSYEISKIWFYVGLKLFTEAKVGGCSILGVHKKHFRTILRCLLKYFSR